MTRGPKDFTEVMSGIIALLVIVTSLALGSYSIIYGVLGADDWRGAFIVAFAGSIAYWVGSSSGSKRKSDAAIAEKVVAAETDKAVTEKVVEEEKKEATSARRKR